MTDRRPGGAAALCLPFATRSFATLSFTILSLAACAADPPAARPTATTTMTMTATAAPAAATPAAKPLEVTWDVTLSPAFEMHERVCWSAPRTRLMPQVSAGLPYVDAAFDGAGRKLAVGDKGIELAGLGADCADLDLDLGRAAAELDDRDNIQERAGVLITSPDIWLWRPVPWPAGVTGTLRLHLPKGMTASVPWAQHDDGRYVVGETTWTMMCKAAFGPLEHQTLAVGGATFRVARVPGAIRASDAGLVRWLSAAASAVSLVDGRFPVPRAQILLLPVNGGRAVPFGMAIRGGGPAAVVLVSARARDADLLGEWVGVHELSHLLIPPVKRRDAWLSEGLASYYQQIARGRAGLLDDDVAWAALVDGFDRGKAQSVEPTLADASHHMGDRYEYVPVYWGGAAILLRLDVALRQKGRSLDELVAGVRVREPADVTYRAADEIVGWWAEAAPEVDVRGIVARGLRAPFPPVDDLLAALGIVRAGEDAVHLDDRAPLASIRKAIMTRPRDDNARRNVLNSAR